MSIDVQIDRKEDSSSDEDEEEVAQPPTGPPKSFWDLLEATVRAREQQSRELNLAEHQPRSAVAPELEPFVNSTRWPHDNTPLPEYLVSIARPRPTRFTPRFDNTNQWTFYKLDAAGRCNLSVLCCACFLLPLMSITLWLLTWCPDDADSLESTEQYQIIAACDHIGNTTAPGCATIGQLGASDSLDDEPSCSKVTRFAVLSTFIVLLGCPGIFCLISAMEPIIDHVYYYYRPLGRQLYVNYPEVFDGYGPMGQEEPETRLVNHLRALTLFYTVDRLSRLPAPTTRWGCLQHMLWQCRTMYHFQWARSHREWVLRVDVFPDGTVACKICNREITAADLCCDFLYRVLERVSGHA